MLLYDHIKINEYHKKKWINKKLLLYDDEKYGPAITFLSLPFFSSNFFSVLSQHYPYDSWKLSADGGPCKAKSSNLFTHINKMCWATLKRLIGIWNCELWSWFAMNDNGKIRCHIMIYFGSMQLLGWNIGVPF